MPANTGRALPDLAMALNNLANRLGAAGRREPALAAAEEALTHYRALADANPDAFLPNLATALNNLANHLSAAGRAADADTRFQALHDRFGDQPRGRAVVSLAHARWAIAEERLQEAVGQLRSALSAFEDSGDPFGRAESRELLRALRRQDAERFDEAWPEPPPPVWLARLTDEPELTQQLIAWIQTRDWAGSRSHLAEHAAELLTDAAEAALEHLIDANPSLTDLHLHLLLLTDARANGIPSAYAALDVRLLRERTLSLLGAWIDTPTWPASQTVAQDAASGLLAGHTAELLDALAAAAPRDLALRLHQGLLALAISDGIDTAFGLLADPVARRAAIDDAQANASTPRLLALARLASGTEQDNPEAHFRLAAVALQSGNDREAAAAIADTADNAAPFERRDFLRRLEGLTGTQPNPQIDELRRLLGPAATGARAEH